MSNTEQTVECILDCFQKIGAYLCSFIKLISVSIKKLINISVQKINLQIVPKPKSPNLNFLIKEEKEENKKQNLKARPKKNPKNNYAKTYSYKPPSKT